MEGLLEWFIQEFVLFHCFSGNKEKLVFSLNIKVEPCDVANLLALFESISFGSEILILFQVGI